MNSLLKAIKRVVPRQIFSFFQPVYHFSLALLGNVIYGFPSRDLMVIGITGTKGKSSTVEFLNAAFEAVGKKTALAGTVRTKIGSHSERNLTRMSTQGRFFLNRFLRRAVSKGADVAILELTSEAAKQYRHRFLQLDALIFTNLSPEHLESHGSYENYSDAKFELGIQLMKSCKRPRIIAALKEDAQSSRYLSLPVEVHIPFSLSDAAPFQATSHGGFFTLEQRRVPVHLAGEFSLKNAFAAALVARACGVSIDGIIRGFDALKKIPGRAEHIEAQQDFSVVVDYAHTPDSLKALYDAFNGQRKICVLGSTGGGRDKWKRPVMGQIADESCDVVILTNEDPYDEDPRQIIDELASGMKRAPQIILDRREAIRFALSCAQPHDAVLVSGKGTDPNIMGPHGSSVPWSDARVCAEELNALRKR